MTTGDWVFHRAGPAFNFIAAPCRLGGSRRVAVLPLCVSHAPIERLLRADHRLRVRDGAISGALRWVLHSDGRWGRDDANMTQHRRRNPSIEV
jgi:hypothetical protein